MKTFKEYNQELDEGIGSALASVAKGVAKGVGKAAVATGKGLGKAALGLGKIGLKATGSALGALASGVQSGYRPYQPYPHTVVNVNQPENKPSAPPPPPAPSQVQNVQRALPQGGDDIAARNADENERATSDMARRIASTVTKRLTRRFIRQMKKAGDRRSLPTPQPELFDDAKGGIPVSSGQKYPLGF